MGLTHPGWLHKNNGAFPMMSGVVHTPACLRGDGGSLFAQVAAGYAALKFAPSFLPSTDQYDSPGTVHLAHRHYQAVPDRNFSEVP